jgi:hypothetical protein
MQNDTQLEAGLASHLTAELDTTSDEQQLFNCHIAGGTKYFGVSWISEKGVISSSPHKSDWLKLKKTDWDNFIKFAGIKADDFYKHYELV